MKKIERCQVRNFHFSIFLQTKKMIKIHTFTPIFLYHIAVARTFSQKKKLAHSMRMYGHRKLRKKRKKSKSSELSFSRVSGCNSRTMYRGRRNIRCELGWSRNRVKFQKMIYSSFLHECTKKEGFPTSRGLNLKIKPWRQNYRLPMAIEKSP